MLITSARTDEKQSTPAPDSPRTDIAGRHLQQLREAEAHLVDAIAHARASVRCYERALALLVDAQHHLDPPRATAAIYGAVGASVSTASNGGGADVAWLNSACGRDQRLTERESQILQHIAAGLSNRTIAEVLFLSPRTVERHIANIYRKIDAHCRTDAIAYAQRGRLDERTQTRPNYVDPAENYIPRLHSSTDADSPPARHSG